VARILDRRIRLRKSCRVVSISSRDFGAAHEHLVDEPVLGRFIGTEEVVPLGVALDRLDVLTGVLGQNLVEALTQVQDLLRMNLDVRRLPL